MSTLAELPQETNSLLVSNLPGFITVEDLTANFQILGAVDRVTILQNSNININGNQKENGNGSTQNVNSGNLEAVIQFTSSDDAARAARGVFSIFPEFSLWKVQISFTNAQPAPVTNRNRNSGSKKSVNSFGKAVKKPVSGSNKNDKQKKKPYLIISKSLFGAAFGPRTEIKNDEDSDNENDAESLRPSTVSSSLTTKKKRKVAEVRRKPIYKRRHTKLKRDDNKIQKHNLSTIEEKSVADHSEENEINHGNDNDENNTNTNIQDENHQAKVPV